MASTAGDYLCERLATWGVTTLYGFPEDGILGTRRRQNRLRFIRTRVVTGLLDAAARSGRAGRRR
jgi:thiamine pyrophosphate-dependent acetolactate synthase large subunit-like protein